MKNVSVKIVINLLVEVTTKFMLNKKKLQIHKILINCIAICDIVSIKIYYHKIIL
jgi:ribosomal protein S17